MFIPSKIISSQIFTLFALSFWVASNCCAQPNLKDLSASERIELAQEEMEQAAKDTTFIRLMDDGHALFSGQHYLKAIHRYKAAQKERPNNVYPKVIIADIELSMKDTLAILRKREAEKQARANSDTVATSKWTPPDTARQDSLEKQREKNQSEWIKRTRRDHVATLEKQNNPDSIDLNNGDIKHISVAEMQKQLAQQYPDGVTERTFKKGNAIVTERIVVKSSIGNKYRRVAHAWGGVFYFKNGNAITEATWKRETE